MTVPSVGQRPSAGQKTRGVGNCAVSLTRRASLRETEFHRRGVPLVTGRKSSLRENIVRETASLARHAEEDQSNGRRTPIAAMRPLSTAPANAQAPDGAGEMGRR